jgi:hypothetical protein
MAIIKDWENKKNMARSNSVATGGEAPSSNAFRLVSAAHSFLTIDWMDDDTAHVTLSVKDYPQTGVTLEELIPTIEYIRKEAKSMIIRADLEGAGIISIDRFKSIVKIVSEVVEYTKNDNLLRQIQFIGTGVVFRMLYRPISLAIPKYFRDMVVFL